MAVPVVIAVAFLVGDPDGTDETPGVVETSVPAPAADLTRACAPVLAAMPGTLSGGDGIPTLSRLTARPGGPTFLAWGQPLVTLQCGVDRPTELASDVAYTPIVVGPSSDPGAAWIASQDGDRTTWTAIDRAVYVRVTLPTGDVGYLVPVSQILAAKLPPVCDAFVDATDPPDTLYCGSRP